MCSTVLWIFSETSLKYWSIMVSETASGPGLVYSLGQIFELRLLTIVVIKVDMSDEGYTVLTKLHLKTITYF